MLEHEDSHGSYHQHQQQLFSVKWTAVDSIQVSFLEVKFKIVRKQTCQHSDQHTSTGNPVVKLMIWQLPIKRSYELVIHALIHNARPPTFYSSVSKTFINRKTKDVFYSEHYAHLSRFDHSTCSNGINSRNRMIPGAPQMYYEMTPND